MTGTDSDRLRKLLAPSLAALVWIFVFAMGVLGPKAGSFASGDGDLALHVLLGDLMRQTGWVLPTEPTMHQESAQPFIAHEWLSELLFSLLHSVFGLAGPVLIVAAVVATTLLLVLRRMRAGGASPWPQVLVLVGAMTLLNHHLVVRPHVFSWLLLIVWLGLLERFDAGALSWRRCLALGGPVMVLWTNLHGGWVLGFFVLGLFGLAALWEACVASQGERRRALERFRGLLLLGCCLLLLSGLNPFGFRLHLHILEFMNQPRILANVAEFVSPNFHRASNQVFLLCSLFVFLLLILGRRRPAAVEWMLAFAFFWQSLVSVRNQALFGIVAAPLAARRLEQLLREAHGQASAAGRLAAAVLASSARVARSDRRLGGWLSVGAAGLGIVVFAWARGPEWIRFDPALQPVAALDFVERHPERFRGRMFNSYRWGGFISYRTYPEHKTFINGLNDHYGPDLLETYLSVSNLRPQWRAVLDGHDVEWILFDSESALAGVLRDDPGWVPVYSDPLATIFVRASARTEG